MIDRRQFVAFFAGALSAGWDHVKSGSFWIAFRRKPAVHIPDDPIGYDTSDPVAAMRAMTGDALSGRTRDAVRTELVAMRRQHPLHQLRLRAAGGRPAGLRHLRRRRRRQAHG